jgi:hypothetical protein
VTLDANTLWVNTPGEWMFQEYIRPFDLSTLPANAVYHPFVMHAWWDRPTCIRYSDPFVLKDGRIIRGVVEQGGTPGEPGWSWMFYVTEYVDGPIEVHVTTTDCKVS